MESVADHARLTNRITFMPRAATRLGVKPNSVMRAAIAHRATASATRALSTSTTCSRSKGPAGALGSRAEMEYNSKPRTITNSRSNMISTSRWMSTARPVPSTTPKNTSSTIVNSGVNSRASTGAMFSITLCFASTSQEAISTAPAAPHGSIHDWMTGSTRMPTAWKIPAVSPTSTPPPSAISA